MGAMRIRISAFVMAAALVVGALLPAGPASASPNGLPGMPQYLFTIEAGRGTTSPLAHGPQVDEAFTLTLSGLDPVTMFADRPFRKAKLISIGGLVANWSTWFASSPPNAVLTFGRPGQAPGSMVVTLTRPRVTGHGRSVQFTAIRDARTHDPAEKGRNWRRATTPTAFTGASLFIDDAGPSATPDTTPPVVSNFQVVDFAGSTMTCTFDVTDYGSGVANIGTVHGFPSVAAQGPRLTSTQGDTNTYTVILTVASGTSPAVSVALSSAVDRANNAVTNIPLGTVQFGIV